MGACNSSAALDPTDVTGDGSAPVYWSPERDQEKRAAKLRETQQKQQAEIERATGHLKKHTSGRRSTMSKSKEEEKQQADESTVIPSTVQPTRPSRTSRPVSVSFPSPAHAPVVTEEELSEYPVPKSSRRHARATSASSSMASPPRSPEVSVSIGMRSEADGLYTPRQQATPMTSRRSSMKPEPVNEGEERQADEEKEVHDTTPPPPPFNATAIQSTTAATPTITPVQVVTLPNTPREGKVEAVERMSVSGASAAFGVQLRRVSTATTA